MARSRFRQGISDFFGIVDSAISVSAAVREHRNARTSDLARLGIDPEQFKRIGR